MAINLNLASIVTGFNTGKINSNFQAIQNALADVLSRSGSNPNSMSADIDLNSNDLLNGGTAQFEQLIVDGEAFFPGNVSVQGDKGWSPVFAIIADTTRRVLKLVDYSGGGGTKPTDNIGQYVTASGFSSTIANGVDIRGATGIGTGDMLAANNLSDLADKSTSRINLGIGSIDNTADTSKPVSTAQAAADLVAQSQDTVYNPQTGTSYTLVLGDAGGMVTMSNSSPNTLTIPLNSSVAFPIKTKIDIGAEGAGATTIAIAVGGVIHSANGKVKLTGQYSGASLKKIGTDEWRLYGDLA